MKTEITIDQFIERYWEKEFNTLFSYVAHLKSYMGQKDRELKEITTEVFTNGSVILETWDYVQINWVWVSFEQRL